MIRKHRYSPMHYHTLSRKVVLRVCLPREYLLPVYDLVRPGISVEFRGEYVDVGRATDARTCS